MRIVFGILCLLGLILGWPAESPAPLYTPAARDVQCTDCVTLGTETAGNYVASVGTSAPLSGGAGGSEGAALTLSVAADGIGPTQIDETADYAFSGKLFSTGALTCGSGTAGKVKVHTTPLEYCDNAATPALQYSAYGDASGNATGLACAGSCVSDAEVDDGITLTNITQVTTRSHASLQNLSADDHSQYVLLAGRTGTTNNPTLSSSGNGTLTGSTNNGSALILNASSGTLGDVLFNQGITSVAGTVAQFAGVDAAGLALSGTSPQVFGFAVGSTRTVSHEPWTYSGTTGEVYGFDHTPRLQNDSGNSRTLQLSEGYRFDPEYRVNGSSTFTITASRLLEDASVFDRVTAGQGTLTVSEHTGFYSAPNINTGATATNRRGVWFRSPGGGGAQTNAFGLDCEDQTATTSVACLYSNLNSAAGKWAVYGVGTANSALGGGLRVGNTTAPTDKLEVLGNVLIDNSGTANGLKLKGTSTGITTIKAGAQGSTAITYVVPTAQGNAGEAITNDGAGNLSWKATQPVFTHAALGGLS